MDWMPMIEQVIEQAEQRVLNEQAVAAQEKVVSLYEPHTQVIRRGKVPPHVTEFGHKENYAEVEHGLLSDWRLIAQRNSPDGRFLPPLLQQYRQRFRHAPHLLVVNRAVFSPENETLAQRMRIQHIVLTKPGYRDRRRQRR